MPQQGNYVAMPPVNPGSGLTTQPTASPAQPIVQVPGQQVYYHPVMRSTEMMARQSVVYLQPPMAAPQVQPGATPTIQTAHGPMMAPQAGAGLPRSMDAVDMRSLYYSTNACGTVGAYNRTQTSGQSARSGRWVFVQDNKTSGAAAPSTAAQSAG